MSNHPLFYFDKGISHRDLFDLKFRGEIWTIPERFKYNDKAKTVKPLDIAELGSILKLFERENRGHRSSKTISPSILSGWNQVSASLSMHDGMIENEKQLEGAILGLLRDSNSVCSEIFGDLDFVANAIPSFYLDFMDIYGYQHSSNRIFRHVVIELKKDSFAGIIGGGSCPVSQVLKYRDWIVQNRASGDLKAVDSYVVAKHFDQSYIESTETLNRTFGYKVVRLVQYDVVSSSLVLTEVTS